MLNIIAVNETSEITEEQYSYILNHIKYEKLKDMVEHEETKKTFCEEAEISKFLSGLNTRTKNIYAPIISEFKKYVTHLLDVNTLTVDAYISDLAEKYAPSTVRLSASALSSLYNKLCRLGYITTNPFTKCDLPKNKRSKELVVPDKDEVKEIIAYYEELYFDSDVRKAESARKMLGAILLMTRTGLRVGALEALELSGNVYTTISKGKSIKGKIDQTLLETLVSIGFDLNQERPFWELNKPLVQFNLNKALTLLHKTGTIKHVYHPHSFRHYYAVKTYKENNDIYMVSRLLNHSSIAVTQRYLESLELDKE